MILTNDFNTKRPSDSVLPRVRSEINRYLAEGENGIDSFYLEYKEMVAKDLMFRGYGGVLEEMFGGLAESSLVALHEALGTWFESQLGKTTRFR